FQGEGRGEGRWQDRCVQEFVAWRSPLTLALSPRGRGKYVEQSETLPGLWLPCARLEELQRIPVRIFQLDLLAPWSDFHLVPEMQSGLLEGLDARGKIRHSKDDPIPATRLLMTPVGQRAGARRARTAQKEVEVLDSNVGERGKLLVQQLEPEIACVELDR